MLSTVVVAMDGTSGSGKSSTARGVARRLGLRYLDTGAQFRALTWWLLTHGVDVEDPGAVAHVVDRPLLQSGTDPNGPSISVDDQDVSTEVRSAEVTAAVSAVSAVPEVRSRLLDLQREIIGDGGIVVEGRDIGSVVWPQAEVKLYLTADASARAARRTAQDGRGTQEATEADLARRDALDSGRATAPAVAAADATPVDTTAHTLDEVVDQIVAMVERASASR